MRKKLLIMFALLSIIIVAGCVNNKGQGQSCTSTDGINSDCKSGLLCNVGSGGINGVCNTVQQCISSGSGAEAFEGSEVCFMGV